MALVNLTYDVARGFAELPFDAFPLIMHCVSYPWAKASKSQCGFSKLTVTLSDSKREGEKWKSKMHTTAEFFCGSKSTLIKSHHSTPAAHWNLKRIKFLGNLKFTDFNVEFSNYSNIYSQFANFFVIF